MIISSASDYRGAAKRKLPRFLFDYIDGGAYAAHTLRANSSDLANVSLRQRILKKVDNLSLKTTLFKQEQNLPLILSPVGLTGMYARRGEVQMAKAAANKGIPSVCRRYQCAPLRKSLRKARSRFGSNCMSSKIVALCATPWSGPRRRA